MSGVACMTKLEESSLTKEQKECKSQQYKFGDASALGIWGCDGSITTLALRWSVHFSRLNLTKEQAIEIAKKIHEVTK